ncbi:YrhK family protein [Oceanobacillus alkalisoli]|uniref:YrhK family protein n=1 Tax=Oceanobacillus alkalisoli TaxID=2925113 RepID=UPI001EEF7A01|nr:YrhK family protein [Oceanobacillus alkalisoli]MCF3942808.1 YrhK family protein [Oceanobacillus alkalisoli]MCG5102472.1 YrhK family protein [Oceanobacillus alkalisoli]
MPLFPKIKTKEQGNQYDLEITYGRFRLYIIKKYDSIQLIGDILTGISFVSGSILNLTGAPSMYGQILYLIGSLALTVRPTIKVIRRSKLNKDK